ncbi:MAG: PssD/Cps14F family polysaccharide biosynthesis glycosyltransferase [Enterococcus sp.]
MKKKICLIASSGGHYEQLLMLRGIEADFNTFYVTEKTPYNGDEANTYYLHQVNRHEKTLIPRLIANLFKSIFIFIKEKPDTIISTGVLSVIPMFLIGKIFCKKLIYIESFAKSSSPTVTGKLLYKYVDVFIVQWETMKKFYPDAIYLGTIY